MRMVSNKHVSPNSVKKFKRVHVMRKAYIAKNKMVETPVESVNEIPVSVVKEIENPQVELIADTVILDEKPLIDEAETVTVTAKKTRKKKVVMSDTENNEEKTESHE